MLVEKAKYIVRVTSKVSSFAVFGIGSFVLGTAIFPLLHILSGFSAKRFRKMTRYFISKSFVVFVKYIEITGSMRLSVKHREILKGAKSKVIVANHPSILDVVILISLVPNADCIVKGALIENKFISTIIRNLYIPNTLPFEKQLEMASGSMAEGNNLIIFPEGTRTRPGEPWAFKKGAARFAIHSKSDVIPVYFGGNEKIGLRKHDKMLSHHPTERHFYDLEVLPQISVAEYLDMPSSKSAILLTDAMKVALEQKHLNS
ncbi:MAG: 1-acyl-sn-glycerol-3-phosphate acyltransferase [Fibrobacter sp.]|nr:1-acyl-sn-glycerol-3-phosphate acyltransferase [Fibrobacter sp.]